MSNGAVDAGLTTEPAATYAVEQKIAVEMMTNDKHYPNSDATHIIYSAISAEKRPDVAKCFIRAFIKAMRFYDRALADCGLRWPNADEVIKIPMEFTDLKNPRSAGPCTPRARTPTRA
jgi:NitT/TauT family transport system substrate-binding protein